MLLRSDAGGSVFSTINSCCADEFEKVFVESFLQVGSRDIFIITLRFLVGEQRRIENDKARMRQFVLTAIVQQADGECGMRYGAEAAPAAAARLPPITRSRFTSSK